jgi:hemerythrin-like domain-containing protein
MPKARRVKKTSPKKTSVAETILTRAASAAGKAVGRTVGVVATRVMPAGPHDPIALLEKDHRRLEALLKRGSETTARAAKGRAALLQTLTTELAAHELKEEKVLYPALKRHSDAREIVLEGYQEHHVADVLVKELQRMATTDERWGAKFKVLKENIEHHIEEEEGEMFRTARSVMSRDRLAALGTQMETMNGAPHQRPARTRSAS